jgi:hypothetical protein
LLIIEAKKIVAYPGVLVEEIVRISKLPPNRYMVRGGASAR